MPNYLLLSVCLTVACAVSSAAATGEDLIPHGAASSAGRAPLMLTAAEAGKDGPTPYPKDEKDWPGVGVIRVFDFMTGERQLIWSQRQVNQGAVIFVGDSIIGGWKTLKDDFAPLHVANSGVGGDVSRGVLLRLQEDVIDLAPKAVVILIGGNDMSAREDLSLLMSNLKSILKMLRGYKHSLPIVLCKIPPGDNPAVRLDLNSRLNRLSKSNSTLVLLDLYQLLALPDGSVDPQNFVEDKIHLSPAGYKKFHDALIPIFRRLKVVNSTLIRVRQRHAKMTKSEGNQTFGLSRPTYLLGVGLILASVLPLLAAPVCGGRCGNCSPGVTAWL